MRATPSPYPPINLPAMRVNVYHIDTEPEWYGAFAMLNQAILLNEDCAPDLMRSTLIHEVIHGCLENLGIHEGHDENTINGIAIQLLYFLQNNPAYVAYLADPSLPFPELKGQPSTPTESATPKTRKRPSKKTPEKRAGQGRAPKATKQGSAQRKGRHP